MRFEKNKQVYANNNSDDTENFDNRLVDIDISFFKHVCRARYKLYATGVYKVYYPSVLAKICMMSFIICTATVQ